MISKEEIPKWILNLEPEDLMFLKRLALYSGSLKDLAKFYGITYPTVRLRLDRLIEKIKAGDSETADPFVEEVRQMAMDDLFSVDTAKRLIKAYKKEHGNGD
jgi:hypothetical protein